MSSLVAIISEEKLSIEFERISTSIKGANVTNHTPSCHAALDAASELQRITQKKTILFEPPFKWVVQPFRKPT